MAFVMAGGRLTSQIKAPLAELGGVDANRALVHHAADRDLAFAAAARRTI